MLIPGKLYFCNESIAFDAVDGYLRGIYKNDRTTLSYNDIFMLVSVSVDTGEHTIEILSNNKILYRKSNKYIFETWVKEAK